MILLHPLALPRLALYQFAGVRPSDDILDIGTGAGFAPRAWAKVARSVLGVDISAATVEMAADATPPELRERVRFECADACDPAFGKRYAGQFDLVTSSDAFEHVQDPDAFVETIATVLRPGGRAVITFPNETDGHGITSFPDSAALIDLFARHGLAADIRVLSLAPWADTVHQWLWRRLLVAFRKRRKTYATQAEQPQVMHETWYCQAARKPRKIYLLVNAYARLVELLMRLGGPVFRACIVQPGGRYRRPARPDPGTAEITCTLHL